MSRALSFTRATQYQPLTAETLEGMSHLFGALAEPMRLRLIQQLLAGEKNVGELVAATSASQSNISHHLRLLLEVAVISRRKAGLQVYYRISDPLLAKFYDLAKLNYERAITAQAKAFKRQ